MVSSWSLSFILIQLSIIIYPTTSLSVFHELHEVEKCIKPDDQLLCIQLNSISSSIPLSFYVKFNGYPYDYTSGTITSSTLNLATACFPYITTTSIAIKFYNANTNEPIPSEDTSISMAPSWSTLTTSIIHPPSSSTNFKIWIAEEQCFELTKGDMFIEDDFIVKINFHRANAANSISPSTLSTQNIISTSTQNQNQNSDEITGSDAIWNTLICLQGSPDDYNNDLDYITADISITSKWTGNTYDLLYTNNKPIPIHSKEYDEYQGSDGIIAHFAIGEIEVKYWQSCESACNDKFGPCWDDEQHKLLQRDFPLYVGLIILFIWIIIMIMLLTAYLNHKYYYKC